MLSDVSCFNRRILISNLFIRLVNGFIDSSQKTKRNMPISLIGKMLNVPPMFIQIRHDATHRRLPSLKTLEKELQRSLTWLKNVYWHPQYLQLVGRRVNIQMFILKLEKKNYPVNLSFKIWSEDCVFSEFIPLFLKEIATYTPRLKLTSSTISNVFKTIEKKWNLHLKLLQKLFPSFTAELIRTLYLEIKFMTTPWKNALLICWHKYFFEEAKILYTNLEIQFLILTGIGILMKTSSAKIWISEIIRNIKSIYPEQLALIKILKKELSLNYLFHGLDVKFKDSWFLASDATILWGTIQGPLENLDVYYL